MSRNTDKNTVCECVRKKRKYFYEHRCLWIAFIASHRFYIEWRKTMAGRWRNDRPSRDIHRSRCLAISKIAARLALVKESRDDRVTRDQRRLVTR